MTSSKYLAAGLALAILSGCSDGGGGDPPGDGGPRDGGGGGGGGDASSGDAGDPTVNWPSASATLEDEVLTLVNQRRAAGATCGSTVYPPTTPLSTDARLTHAARSHSYDMVARDFFDHVNPDGATPFQRMTTRGYVWSNAGENIAQGDTTAAGVMNTWMNSPNHCSNIMNPNFEHIGIGFYMNTWTQVFGALL